MTFTTFPENMMTFWMNSPPSNRPRHLSPPRLEDTPMDNPEPTALLKEAMERPSA
jgi:hypothetical protein